MPDGSYPARSTVFGTSQCAQEGFRQGFEAALEQCRGEQALLVEALKAAQDELEKVQANAAACASITQRQARLQRWEARAKAFHEEVPDPT